MEIKKLESALKSPIALLSVNGLIYALLLYWVYNTNWKIAWFVFILWAIFLYVKYVRNEALRPALLFFSFVVSSVVASVFAPNYIVAIIVASVCGLLAWIFCGAQSFVIGNPKIALGIFFHSVIFLVTALFALIPPVEISWWHWIVLFVFYYGAFKDYLKLETLELDRRKRLWAIAFSFIATQVIWIGSLLPIGFLNVGSLVLISSILVGNVAIRQFAGTLSKKTTLKEVGILGVFILVILAIGLL